jgi:adenylate cyclase
MFGLICAVCGGLVLVVFVVAPYYWGPALTFRQAEMSYARIVAGWGNKSPERDDLVFVGIDDTSVNLLESGVLGEDEIAASEALDLMSYGYPYPRQVWGMLAERLIGAGAKVVVFDLLFTQQAEGDEYFKGVLDRYHDRVVIGADMVKREEQERTEQWYMKEAVGAILDPGGAGDKRQGFVNFFPYLDNRVWEAGFKTRLTARREAPEWKSLAAAALTQAGYGDRIPEEGTICIRFADPNAYPQAYEPLPLYSVFDDKYWAQNYQNGGAFKDKIVLVGASSVVEFRDDAAYPFGRIRGPEIHLNTIATVLNGDYYHFASQWTDGVLIAVAALVAFLVAFLMRHPLLGVIMLLTLAGLYVFGTVMVYNAGFMLTGVGPLSAFMLSGIMCFGAQYTVERLEKLRLKRALDRYFSKELTDEILARPDDFIDSMGGKRMTVTVLFSDLRNFTAKSEEVDERELVAQLNEYLEEMVACVFNNGGMVDKFIGDAVMAVWGAVNSKGDEADAEGAVRAAMAMRERLAVLNEKWESEGRQTHAFGVGINQGPAVFGNIGSLAKMELTVIGDAVNLASRLEGLTKQFGVDLLVSGSVAAPVEGKVLLQPIDRVVPKGKSEAVDVFAIPGHSEEDLAPGEAEYLVLYHDAHAAWCAADPDLAGGLFKRCAEMRPDDKTVQLYLARLGDGSSPESMRRPRWATEK